MVEMSIRFPKTDAPDNISHDDPKITSSLHPNYSTSVKVGNLITTLQITLKGLLERGPRDLGLQGVDSGPSGIDWGPF